MSSDDCFAANYPIPGNEVGGRVMIYGLGQSKIDVASLLPHGTPISIHVLFFCGGFPDHWTTFQPLAQRLSAVSYSISGTSCVNNSSSCAEKRTGIICGVTCLPGYDTHHNNFKKEGYTFDEMAVSLQSACKVLLSTISDHYNDDNNINENSSINFKLTGIFHDWGSYIGAMVVNRSNILIPNYFHKVVFLDVLPPAHPKLRIVREKLNIFKGLIMMSYTSLFALCHAIQRYVSFWCTIPLYLIGYSTLFVTGLLPIRWLDNTTFLSDRPKEYSLRKIIYMQYPYYYFWRGLLRLGLKQFLKTTLSDATLPEHVCASNDGTSVLYMYGTVKNTMFHDTNTVTWLQQATQHPSLVVKVNDAGHWLYRQKEDICFDAICAFIGIS